MFNIIEIGDQLIFDNNEVCIIHTQVQASRLSFWDEFQHI